MKKKTIKLTDYEMDKAQETWLNYLNSMNLTEEEFSQLWESGLDVMPMRDYKSHFKSEMDH